MYHSMKILLMVITIISTTNGFYFKTPRVNLQSQTDSLLAELRSTQMDSVLYWNLVTLQACANDFDKSVTNAPEQDGPTGASRAFAIIHGAMYDAMMTFTKSFKPRHKYQGMPRTDDVHKDSAVDAAIMQAAYETLSDLYSKQKSIFDACRDEYLRILRNRGRRSDGINRGILVGKLVAAYILTIRRNDGSKRVVSYTPVGQPGYHDRDPTSPGQGFVGVNWGSVTPFVLDYGSQYRPSNVVGDSPNSRRTFLYSSRYARDFNEVKSLGYKYSTTRTAEQTEIGIFWAYDGVPKLGVPPRLYNQVVRKVAIQQRNTLQQNARLFALVNYAMADAGIAAWDCKYYYNLWRPILGIRNALERSWADPNWVPLGAPADNSGNNFTPGFPSYVSGHSTFGSAVFETLRRFYGTDYISFQFQSDEFNGKTVDSITKQARAPRTRHYYTFSQAEKENFDSRIYLGVHWRTDQEEGQTLGRRVAEHVFNRL